MYAFICACVCRHTDCAFNINNRQACNWLHWTPTNMTYCDSDFLPLRQKAWKITLKEETFVSSHSFRDVCPRLASSIECRHVPREIHYGIRSMTEKALLATWQPGRGERKRGGSGDETRSSKTWNSWYISSSYNLPPDSYHLPKMPSNYESSVDS